LFGDRLASTRRFSVLDAITLERRGVPAVLNDVATTSRFAAELADQVKRILATGGPPTPA
jgi:hypothetical protein